MQLSAITDGIWQVEYDLKIGIIPLAARMTVVRLSNGGLWVHSPAKISDGVAGEIRALGDVAAIVAPNQFHHLYITDFIDATAPAPVFAAPGLERKRKDLNIAETLHEIPPSLWTEDFEQIHIQGMPKFDEHVFLHKPTRTLIATDLVFNLGTDMPFMGRLSTKIFGTYGKFASSRLFKSFIKDKAAFRRSVERLDDWDFDRIIMAHGNVLESGGKAAFTEAWPT
jgi:hypothetical protein